MSVDCSAAASAVGLVYQQVGGWDSTKACQLAVPLADVLAALLAGMMVAEKADR